MKLVNKNKPIKTEVYLPRSKSISNRSLIIDAICGFSGALRSLSTSEDTKVLNRLLHSYSSESVLDIGAAGTAMRFSTAFLASQNRGRWLLKGTNRMSQRPIHSLVDGLRELGAAIFYEAKEGFPPLRIIGNQLEGDLIEMDASVSSQFISAILLIAPTLPNGISLSITGEITSAPYLHTTLAVMKEFGAHFEWQENIITIFPKQYTSKDYTIEVDWTSASYWYEIVALSKNASIFFPDLIKNSIQGDVALIGIYKSFGVDTIIEKNGIRICKNSNALPDHVEMNLNDSPDLVQTIICTCAGLNISGVFSGLNTLRIKETDRCLALQNELKKFNVKLELLGEDTIVLKSHNGFPKSVVSVETYNDHRMAMSFAPLVIKTGQITIENPDVIKKSYPNFWSDLEKAGVI